MPEYAVVKFVHTEEVAAIHTSWKTDIHGQVHCYWPKNDPTAKARSGEKPALDGTWTLNAVEIIIESDKWNAIVHFLTQAENLGDLDSDEVDAIEIQVKRIMKKPRLDSFRSSFGADETISREGKGSLPIPNSDPVTIQNMLVEEKNPKESDVSLVSDSKTAVHCTSSSSEPNETESGFSDMHTSECSSIANSSCSHEKGVTNSLTSDIGPVTTSCLLEHILDIKRVLWQALLAKDVQPNRDNEAMENATTIEDLIPNPMNTRKELLAFDDKLADCKTLREPLVASLRTIGGTDVNDFVRKMLRKIATNGVLSLYCCQGRSKNKFSMCKLRICKAMFRACRLAFPAIDETKFKIALGDVLRHAPYQKGGSRWKGKAKSSTGTSDFSSSDDEACALN